MYIDLILTLSEGLDLNILLKKIKKYFKGQKKGLKRLTGQVFLTLSMILDQSL